MNFRGIQFRSLAVLVVVFCLTVSAASQENDVYVGNSNTSTVTRYNGTSGAFVDFFVLPGAGGLSFPTGVSFGPDGNLYVASLNNSRILKYDGLTGAFLGTFIQLSASDRPYTIMFAADHQLYVSSSNGNRVLRFDGSTGQQLGVAASGSGLIVPYGLVIAPDNLLYVVSNNRIMRFNPTTGQFLGAFGSDVLSFPIDMVLGPDNRLYVADVGREKVFRYDYATGQLVGIFGSMPTSFGATGICFQPDSSMFVTDFLNHRLIRFGAAGGTGTIVSTSNLAAPIHISRRREWPSLGSVIQVPQEQPTIQAGINAAQSGDTILVDHGLYRENLRIKGKSIFLTSHFVLDSNPSHILATIIDGSGSLSADSGSTITVASSGTTIQGFTITGGTGTLWSSALSGKRLREGGGILTTGASVTIKHNAIAGNSCNVIGAATNAGGGGIHCGTGATHIHHNIIAYNQSRYGAGIDVASSPGEIKNNVIWKNSGGSGGGAGLLISQSSAVSVENNTIVENSSTGAGGGVYLTLGISTLLNNIIRSNTALISTQIHLGVSDSSAVNSCDVQDGFAGTDNFDFPPLYADSNFLLTPGSPCVDAGLSASGYNDVEDGGNPGFALFPSHVTVRNDMGAYGGQGAGVFPFFTSTRTVTDVASLDFGLDSAGNMVTGKIPMHKNGWGVLRIDSVRFSPASPDLAVATPLPRSMNIVQDVDTLVLSWTPSTIANLSANARIYHNDTSITNPLTVALTGTIVGCCLASTGNVDCSLDDGTDIGDLTALVDHLFVSFAPLCCETEADVDTSSGVDIADVTGLVDHLFISFSPLSACP